MGKYRGIVDLLVLVVVVVVEDVQGGRSVEDRGAEDDVPVFVFTLRRCSPLETKSLGRRLEVVGRSIPTLLTFLCCHVPYRLGQWGCGEEVPLGD